MMSGRVTGRTLAVDRCDHIVTIALGVGADGWRRFADDAGRQFWQLVAIPDQVE